MFRGGEGAGAVLLPGRAEQAREHQLLNHPGVTGLSKQAPEDIHDRVQTLPKMTPLNLLGLGSRHPSFFNDPEWRKLRSPCKWLFFLPSHNKEGRTKNKKKHQP